MQMNSSKILLNTIFNRSFEHKSYALPVKHNLFIVITSLWGRKKTVAFGSLNCPLKIIKLFNKIKEKSIELSSF